MHQNRFRLGLRTRSRWGAYSAPSDFLAGFKGPYLILREEDIGRERKGNIGRKGKGEREGKAGEGKKGREGKGGKGGKEGRVGDTVCIFKFSLE